MPDQIRNGVSGNPHLIIPRRYVSRHNGELRINSALYEFVEKLSIGIDSNTIMLELYKSAFRIRPAN